jgi:hypothetical protein
VEPEGGAISLLPGFEIVEAGKKEIADLRFLVERRFGLGERLGNIHRMIVATTSLSLAR